MYIYPSTSISHEKKGGLKLTFISSVILMYMSSHVNKVASGRIGVISTHFEPTAISLTYRSSLETPSRLISSYTKSPFKLTVVLGAVGKLTEAMKEWGIK